MFVLFTDTNTDLTLKHAKEYGWNLILMPYTINDVNFYPYKENEFNSKEFYDLLRTGVVPKTFALNPEQYIEYFEPYFEKGIDILYVHFSKSMSGTFNSLNIALEDLKEKYPERTCYLVDTKGVSVCSLNIIYEIEKLVKEGKTPEEIVNWSKEEVDHFATYFYADNLTFFKASGRVSNMSATLGNVFGVHPIIYMSDEGQLVNIAKVKGKKSSLRKLVSYVEELGDDIKAYNVIIAHTDNIELATLLKNMLIEKFGDDLTISFSVVNPTIGGHCGPDCIGVSFHSKKR